MDAVHVCADVAPGAHRAAGFEERDQAFEFHTLLAECGFGRAEGREAAFELAPGRVARFAETRVTGGTLGFGFA